MKSIRLSALIIIASVISLTAIGQDIRRTETRVADLLAQMPARDGESLAKYLDQMYALGNEGLDLICKMVVPAGTGDDTPVRFAIEGLSRHLGAAGKDSERVVWEKKCIEWIGASSDIEVKVFFMSQLQYIGSDLSVDAMSILTGDKDLAEPAVSVIVAVGSERAGEVLVDALNNDNNSAVAATLNGLALLKQSTVNDRITALAVSPESDIRAAAYRTLAATGKDAALPILTRAAVSVDYKWEQTGAVSALIDLADNMGLSGNIKGMDKILGQIFSKCDNQDSRHFLSAATRVMVKHHGEGAHKHLLKVMKSDDIAYRGTAMQIAAEIPGTTYTGKWTAALKSFKGARKAEVITMLGNRRDKSASIAIEPLLKDADQQVRLAAVKAIAKCSGREALPALTDYLLGFQEAEDQNVAASTIITLIDKESLKKIAGKIADADPRPASTIVGLLSWSKNQEYFETVLALTSSYDGGVRASSYLALKNLAPESSQTRLLNLLASAESRQEINEIKLALAAAVRNNPDKENRVSTLISALDNIQMKQHIIPVLSMVGGGQAVKAVLDEFENGDARIRDICFEALIFWSDHHSLQALYEIAASGNKTYSPSAFESFVKKVSTSGINPEQKLLHLKKIQPFAFTSDQKEMLIDAAGSIRTYLSLFFVGKYIDEPDLKAAASRAAMKIALPAGDEPGGMTGNIVREILEKSIAGIIGEESAYDKERIRKYIASMPDEAGFEPMFNGVDLTGWQGLVGNPITRARMKPAELAEKQKEADRKALENWSVRDGMIWFSGNGNNLCSVKKYGDFELILDWIITKHGDSGIYLRGSPQVQIWDTSRVDVGAQVGSGGLYNNQKHPSKPPVVADNQVGEWNTFRITMVGEKVNVWLNGILVVDNVVLENYWDRSIPIFPVESIELQAHGTDLAFRDIYVREIQAGEYNLTPAEKAEGFAALFNGKNLDGWIGDKISYVAEDGMIVIKPEKGSGGNLFTAAEYGDFVFRFEFQLTPGANNGLGIRAPLEGDAAYVGMELQILDNTAAIYANLAPYQYHGSVYGVIPAKRGYLKPVGEWNYQEVVAKGNRITITLNGTVIVDGDIAEASANGTIDGQNHPGLKRQKGHVGFLGHGSVVKFRNIRLKKL
jgi:HEAT repeat protein